MATVRPLPLVAPLLRPKHLEKVSRPAHLASTAPATARAASAWTGGDVVSIGLEMVPCARALAAELQALRITDADMAAALGVSRSTAGAMLAGVRHVRLADLRRLARRLPASRPAIAAALASIVGAL